VLGNPHLHLRLTDSTSDRARALAIAGAPHGTLVSAAEQTAGRGRQGRRWSAPANSALLASIVLRESSGVAPAPGHTPGPTAGPPRLLPLIAALAVCDVAGEEAQIKWPNDIVLVRPTGFAKLAGILAEGRPQEGWAVLGIGLNVAVDLDDLPEELREAAATLGRTPAAIEPTLEELLRALERRLAEPPNAILGAYRERDALRDREIGWNTGGHTANGRTAHGLAAGIDGEGRLVVALDGGGHATLDAGEVHLIRL
jgi:BirA family transcriptional regulator, biotin operon repressor / biotin---[acetyl-CoA-carboxylase] ligase